MNRAVSRARCWLIICVLLTTWSGSLSLGIARAEPDAGAEQVASRLEQLLDGPARTVGALRRDTFDPKVIVHGQAEADIAGVGTNPAQVFEWVRDNTYLVPYRGLLRGSQGVLLDRVGNSLDRALLLGDLLFEAGHKNARMAYAHLTTRQADGLLDGARPLPDGRGLERQPPSSHERDQFTTTYARKHGFENAELRRIIDDRAHASQRLAQEAAQRTRRQSGILVEILEARDLIPGRDEQVATVRADAITALRHHWWVQWHDGSKWVDLDPSFPDATPGQRVSRADKTFGGDALHERLVDEVHTLQIRLVIECWERGRLVEIPVLTQHFWPFQWVGGRIAVHHAPQDWPNNLDLSTEEDPLEALEATVLAQREWTPVLSVGDQRVSKLSFTDTCEVNDRTLPHFVQHVLAGRQLVRGFEAGAAQLGARIGDMLGGGRLAGAGVRRKAMDESSRSAEETNEDLKTRKSNETAQLTAEWIEYEIRTPGEEARKIRREIFDLLGPAARAVAQEDGRVPTPVLTEEQILGRGLAALGETEILPLVAELSPEYVVHLQVRTLQENRDELVRLLRSATADSDDLKRLMEETAELRPLPGYLYGLGLSRSEWSARRSDLYLDSLNVLSFHQHLRKTASGQLVKRDAFDIVANRVAVKPDSTNDPFLARLKQGVLDTNAEALLLRGAAPAENTAELFAAAGDRGLEWVVVRRTSDPALEEAHVPADMRARILDDVKNDYVVVAPPSVVQIGDRARFGWWRLDPGTGEILGIGERGWGQTTKEQKGTKSSLTTAQGTALGWFARLQRSKGWRVFCRICDIVSIPGSDTVIPELGPPGWAIEALQHFCKSIDEFCK